MPFGVILSLTLHLAVIVLSVMGLPSLFAREQTVPDAVAVELVTLPEKSPPAIQEVRPRTTPEPEPAPPTEVPPPPAPVEPAPAIVDIPEPVPLPVVAPQPPRQPVPKLGKKPPPPRKRVVVPPPGKKPPPPTRKPPPPVLRPKPEPPPDAFQSLLRNLSESQEEELARQPPPVDRRFQADRIVEAVRQQLVPCWSIPAGAKDVADMRVAIRIRLNPDGALGGVPVVEDSGRLERDVFFRAVAESALRALRDPQCMPLKLPYRQYDLWRNITFYFDPGEALGQ